MSAEKRRNMLYVFGGVVIALLAVIAFVSPRFRSEDASGAIGAVQKHRAPQIQQADVVLGDEQFKNEQKTLYGDYLTDAAALQNVSADIALAARQADAQSRLVAAQKTLEARQADLKARYVANAEALDVALGAKIMASRDQAAQLAAEDMEALNAKLNSEMMALDAKSPANLAAIEADVAAMQARIAANKADVNLAAESADLASLDARYAAAQDRANLHGRYQTLNALWSQSRIVASQQVALAKLASQNLAANDRSLVASADEIAMQLADEAAALESAAVQAMNVRLVSNEAALDSLGKTVANLDSMRQLAQNRNTANAQALHDFDVGLMGVRQNMQAHAANLRSRETMVMNFQLAAIRNMVDNRTQAGERFASLNNHALATRVNNAATLNALWAHLNTMNQKAQDKTLASMADEQAFMNNVKMVMDKTVNLQQRNAQ